MDSDTTQEDQGRLTPRRTALAAALACLPVLVEAAVALAMSANRESIKAHAALLREPTMSPRSTIGGVDVLLEAGLGPILAMCGGPVVSVERRRAKVLSFAAGEGAVVGSLTCPSWR